MPFTLIRFASPVPEMLPSIRRDRAMPCSAGIGLRLSALWKFAVKTVQRRRLPDGNRALKAKSCFFIGRWHREANGRGLGFGNMFGVLPNTKNARRDVGKRFRMPIG
ncbi:MAG: hypothetical protein A3I66_19410 [Burkholderiales bacterium RIFCSPLOWO2_02_FULL_57_36]|nr:MAG: hypothetical protein A3I66_19410 [Burkholderiales bacterium RIFCSPLOWO2_02_FULL_57_36]